MQCNTTGSLTCPVCSIDTQEHLSWEEPVCISFSVILVGVSGDGTRNPWWAVKCFTTEPNPRPSLMVSMPNHIQSPPKVWRQPVIFLLPSIITPCPIKFNNSYAFLNTLIYLTECFIVMNNYFNFFYKGVSILQWWVVHRLLRCGYFQSYCIQC